MLPAWLILLAGFGYLCVLFAIAYWGDKRADAGRSVVASPYVYALSIAVYCTAWTFYGSVGRAASSGIDFLPIYLGPTLVAILWWQLMRKILRISKSNRITSIADFIASRYGKSQLLGGLVTIIAVVVITPYIALQLKGVSASYHVLSNYPAILMPGSDGPSTPFLRDTAFYVAALMAAFAMLYGTRHIDATERHDGMVAAIAFESIIKLVAFLAVGFFVTYVMFDGVADIFTRAAARDDISPLFTSVGSSGYGGWVTLTLLSMAAILFLPRQFQVLVVENVNERHLDKAVWLFPLYLLLINIFVLPLALAGLLSFDRDTIDPDTFVLTLPMLERNPGLALFAFIGGLSAATGMVIVETIALSTMVCNDLVMPILLRLPWLKLTERGDLTRLLIRIRRASIVFILFLGYLRRHLLAWRYTRRRLDRPIPRVCGLGLYAVAAVLRPLGLAARRVPRGRPVGHRPAESLRPVRAGGARSTLPRTLVEHDRQYRRLRCRVPVHAPEPDRARPGHPLCRGLCPGGTWRARQPMARPGVLSRPARIGRPLHRPPPRRPGFRRICGEPRRRSWQGHDRRCGADAIHRAPAGRRDRRRLRARHGCLNRQG
jgi:Na+/proline symporter